MEKEGLIECAHGDTMEVSDSVQTGNILIFFYSHGCTNMQRMTPSEARKLGNALIARADSLDKLLGKTAPK